MALQKDIVMHDKEYKDAYISFEHVIIEGKVPNSVNRNIRAVLFAREQKGSENVICFYNCDFVYDLAAPMNLWEQGYAKAKQLPELAGCGDILE